MIKLSDITVSQEVKIIPPNIECLIITGELRLKSQQALDTACLKYAPWRLKDNCEDIIKRQIWREVYGEISDALTRIEFECRRSRVAGLSEYLAKAHELVDFPGKK